MKYLIIILLFTCNKTPKVVEVKKDSAKRLILCTCPGKGHTDSGEAMLRVDGDSLFGLLRPYSEGDTLYRRVSYDDGVTWTKPLAKPTLDSIKLK